MNSTATLLSSPAAFASASSTTSRNSARFASPVSESWYAWCASSCSSAWSCASDVLKPALLDRGAEVVGEGLEQAELVLVELLDHGTALASDEQGTAHARTRRRTMRPTPTRSRRRRGSRGASPRLRQHQRGLRVRSSRSSMTGRTRHDSTESRRPRLVAGPERRAVGEHRHCRPSSTTSATSAWNVSRAKSSNASRPASKSSAPVSKADAE